jgi:predicted esterase
MQDASSPESFASHSEAMGATLTCSGAYVNATVDQIMLRFRIPAKKVVLCGFQHGSCIALSASMIRISDPYAYTILFEPYILESYYLKDEANIPNTTVVCIDNKHIRDRIKNWINIETDKEFQKYGIVTQGIAVEEGGDDLDLLMMNEAIKVMKKL